MRAETRVVPYLIKQKGATTCNALLQKQGTSLKKRRFFAERRGTTDRVRTPLRLSRGLKIIVDGGSLYPFRD